MLFWVLLMLAFDTPSVVILTVIAALLHESGHIAAMTIICRKGITLPRAVISGLRLKPERALSYTETVIKPTFVYIFNFILYTGWGVSLFLCYYKSVDGTLESTPRKRL